MPRELDAQYEMVSMGPRMLSWHPGWQIRHDSASGAGHGRSNLCWLVDWSPTIGGRD
jgi:hypothetical protein